MNAFPKHQSAWEKIRGNPRSGGSRRTRDTQTVPLLFSIPFLLRCSYSYLGCIVPTCLIGFSAATYRKGERARKIQFRVRPRKNNAALSLSRPLVKSRFQYEGRIFNSPRSRLDSTWGTPWEQKIAFNWAVEVRVSRCRSPGILSIVRPVGPSSPALLSRSAFGGLP